MVADSVYAYAVSTIGSRYGANAWWWTQNNTTVYSSQYSILQNSAINNNFTGVQMAYSGTTNPNSFGPGGMSFALQLAISNGICYWEVWDTDILNTAFDSILTNATCSLSTEIETETSNGNNFQLYPYPASDKLFVSYHDTGKLELIILNTFGQEVFRQSPSNYLQLLMIDISKLKSGVYCLRVTTDKGQVFNHKIMITK